MTNDALIVVAAAVVQERRLLVVSKRAAPEVYYLPGGKPEAGEEPLDTLVRELQEELGVTPYNAELLATVENRAALEDRHMRMTVYTAELRDVPRPAAELHALRWIGPADDLVLAPAVREQVLPLLQGEL